MFIIAATLPSVPYPLLLLRLQKRMEMPHWKLVSQRDPHIGNALSVLVQLGHGRDHIVQMLSGELASVDGEADHVADLLLLFRGL